MKRVYLSLPTLLLSTISFHSSAGVLDECQKTFTKQDYINSIIKSLPGGMLSEDILYVRRGYVFTYDEQHLVPKWAAWHASIEYRDIPKRKSRWSTFRTDPELPFVTDKDYKGWYGSEKNYARGHIVPYYISGGDRDYDGQDADIESNNKIEDMDDACTVFEVNALSNITPQYHDRFNGSKGLWYKLETKIRSLIEQGNEYHLYAGTVFKPGLSVETIGNRKEDESEWKIGVPHGFFKVVYDNRRNQAIGFLFDHAGDLTHGCNLDDENITEPAQCIVDLSMIEDVTGLEFFSALSKGQADRLMTTSTDYNWQNWLSGANAFPEK